ncbi:DNA recombination protein RmuC [Bacteroides fragilis]|uniref:DNA recombination protein RmuC n=1 Tax=Bacteroides fragilis TaxID=817 RepID=UPI001E4A3E46|nr:DNA recombination protein RmuC [Bacteroides fragilis]
MESCGRQLETTIKKMAKDIHDKYVDPPFTTDFAILFLPFESIYAGMIAKLRSLVFPVAYPLFGSRVTPCPPQRESAMFSSTFDPEFSQPEIFPLNYRNIDLFLQSRIVSI